MAKKYILGRISQNRMLVIRYVLTEAALFFAMILLQTTLFSRFRILGVVPDLCFGTLLLVSYFLGKETGAVTGIAVGFTVEALSSTGVAILPVCYLFCGYVCGYFTRAILPKRFTAFLAVLGAAVPVRAIITLVYMCLTYQEIHLPQILLRTLLPEMLTTALFTLALYFPVKKLCEWIGK